jgi:hypothetical protein
MDAYIHTYLDLRLLFLQKLCHLLRIPPTYSWKAHRTPALRRVVQAIAGPPTEVQSSHLSPQTTTLAAYSRFKLSYILGSACGSTTSTRLAVVGLRVDTDGGQILLDLSGFFSHRHPFLPYHQL